MKRRVCYHFLPRSCSECGCTDRWGCDEGCWWIGPRLCSSCAPAHEPGRPDDDGPCLCSGCTDAGIRCEEASP